MIRKVYLYGSLSKFSKDPFEIDANNATMLLSGIECNFPGFKRELSKYHELALVKESGEKEFQSVTEHTWNMPLGDAESIHILPKVEGEGIETAGYLAATLVAKGTIAYYVASAVIFVAMTVALTAITMALAPSPKAGGSERADETPSFIFNGAVNVIEEGYPIPIVYGELITGSIVISVGTEPEDMITRPQYNWEYYNFIPF